MALSTGLGTTTRKAISLENGAIARVARPRYIPTTLDATPVKLTYTTVTAHGADMGTVPRTPVRKVVPPYRFRPLWTTRWSRARCSRYEAW